MYLNKTLMSIIKSLTKNTINYAYKQLCKKHNKDKINLIMEYLSQLAISRIQPYFFAIMGILLIIFLINCLQFYYYMKFLMVNKDIFVRNLDTITWDNKLM